jgi:hypothetical protein
MGGSIKQGKDTIVKWLKDETSVTRILDIGAGCGTYYDLFVNEINLFKTCHWIAIEAWEPAVIESKLQEKYNSVIIEDVREINWDSLDHIDITFMGDVLEHMTKEQAIDLVDKVMTVSRIGIISIPTKHWPQGAVGGNPFEIHVKDDWTHSEVMDTFQKYIIEGINHGKIGTYLLNSAI